MRLLKPIHALDEGLMARSCPKPQATPGDIGERQRLQGQHQGTPRVGWHNLRCPTRSWPCGQPQRRRSSACQAPSAAGSSRPATGQPPPQLQSCRGLRRRDCRRPPSRPALAAVAPRRPRRPAQTLLRWLRTSAAPRSSRIEPRGCCCLVAHPPARLRAWRYAPMVSTLSFIPTSHGWRGCRHRA